MILADGLIVQWVAVSVAVSLLIKHIDHVAAMAHARLEHQQELRPVHLVHYAANLGLDVDRSARIYAVMPALTGSPMTSTRPALAEWRALPRSSSTVAASTAPTTSTPLLDDGELRLDCPDFQTAPADQAAHTWQAFRAPTAADPRSTS
jgi:hypothetical protein